MAERQQRALVLGTAVLVGLWALTFLAGFLPARLRLASVEAALAQRRALARVLDVRAQDLRRMEEEAARLKRELERREAALAGGAETALLSRWQALATRAGVEVTRLAPQAPAASTPATAASPTSPLYQTRRYLLAAEGRRAALLSFLSLLEEPQAGVLAEEVTLASLPAGDRWSAQVLLAVRAPR